jgi:hypothetical protein
MMVGGVLAIPRPRRCHDRMPEGAGVSMVVMAYSNASRCGWGWRLEMRAPRVVTGRLGLLRVDSNGGVRRFAGRRGEDWEWRERRGSPDGVGIERRCLQRLRTPASNLRSLAASWARGRRGKGRGGYGLLIAAGMRRLRQGVMELKGERGVTGNGHRRRFRSKLEDDWQVGPSGQRGKREGGGTDSGLRESGPRAGFFSGPKFVPGVQFHFYFVFLLFSFLFPFFFYSDFQFWVLKSFSYSDLKEIRADQSWSFRSVFLETKPEVLW